MLQESDVVELRALQAKAYGRDGALTEAEAARLRGLESARTAVPEVDGVAPDDGRHPDSVDDAGMADASPPEETATPPGDVAADVDEEHHSPGLRSTARQHWKLVAAMSVALLVIGVGAGWALFGRAADGVALSAEQQERRAELQADGEFDPGSVRAIGEDDDALVWYATKDDGKKICLTLDTAQKSARQCQPAEDLENGNGIGVNLTTESPDGGTPEQLWASAARSMSGEILAIIQRWDTGGQDWLAQFAADERARAEELLEQGFEQYSFSIVGYFRDEPVWYGQRVDDGTPKDCLLVDAIGEIQCVESELAQSSEQALGIGGVTVEDGVTASSWDITLAFTSTSTPYLVITGDVPADQTAQPGASVKPGETLELGGEYQDPIQVEIPSDDADG